MLFDKRNNICSSTSQIANILQRQFSSVFSKPSETDLSAAEFKEPDITFSTFDDLNFNEDFNNSYDEITAMNSMSWKFTFDKFSGKAKVIREPGNPQGTVNTYACVKTKSLID